jgi:NAD(P)-dependent dehydrogenase (short-subunit alcohol dehydrogenase family)
MPTQELSGTTALVTGASRGFGRAIAVALSKHGAHVAGVARDHGWLEELRAQLGDTLQPGDGRPVPYLTTRPDNRLARQQARTACAAALLRWIHVVVTRRVNWDRAIAAGSTSLQQAA